MRPDQGFDLISVIWFLQSIWSIRLNKLNLNLNLDLYLLNLSLNLNLYLTQLNLCLRAIYFKTHKQYEDHKYYNSLISLSSL